MTSAWQNQQILGAEGKKDQTGGKHRQTFFSLIQASRQKHQKAPRESLKSIASFRKNQIPNCSGSLAESQIDDGDLFERLWIHNLRLYGRQRQPNTGDNSVILRANIYCLQVPSSLLLLLVRHLLLLAMHLFLVASCYY